MLSEKEYDTEVRSLHDTCTRMFYALVYIMSFLTGFYGYHAVKNFLNHHEITEQVYWTVLGGAITLVSCVVVALLLYVCVPGARIVRHHCHQSYCTAQP